MELKRKLQEFHETHNTIAMAIIRPVEEENKKLRDALDYAWAIIANASGGNWEKESSDWQTAAAKFRDECYYPSVSTLQGDSK